MGFHCICCVIAFVCAFSAGSLRVEGGVPAIALVQSTITAALNGTDFGSTFVAAPFPSHQFLLINTHPEPLAILSVVITQGAPALFSLNSTVLDGTVIQGYSSGLLCCVVFVSFDLDCVQLRLAYRSNRRRMDPPALLSQSNHLQ